MSEHTALVIWSRGQNEIFTDCRFSREHRWVFDGGATVLASSSPEVMAAPLSVEANVDPEEAFIAALSSCHMLTFLAIAAKQRYIVDSYTDQAIGILSEDARRRFCISRVTLRPQVIFSGPRRPDFRQLEKLHLLAHQHCFIANSVKTEIVIEIAEP